MSEGTGEASEKVEVELDRMFERSLEGIQSINSRKCFKVIGCM